MYSLLSACIDTSEEARVKLLEEIAQLLAGIPGQEFQEIMQRCGLTGRGCIQNPHWQLRTFIEAEI